MAVLSPADRANECAELQRDREACPGGITKAQLAAVVDAIDDWWETTGAGLANAAIPQPQRGSLTPKQKAAIFMRILRRRYEVSA